MWLWRMEFIFREKTKKDKIKDVRDNIKIFVSYFSFFGVKGGYTSEGMKASFHYWKKWLTNIWIQLCPTISLRVRVSVCNAFFSELSHYFFLIFCILCQWSRGYQLRIWWNFHHLFVSLRNENLQNFSSFDQRGLEIWPLEIFTCLGSEVVF